MTTAGQKTAQEDGRTHPQTNRFNASDKRKEL